MRIPLFSGLIPNTVIPGSKSEPEKSSKNALVADCFRTQFGLNQHKPAPPLEVRHATNSDADLNDLAMLTVEGNKSIPRQDSRLEESSFPIYVNTFKKEIEAGFLVLLAKRKADDKPIGMMTAEPKENGLLIVLYTEGSGRQGIVKQLGREAVSWAHKNGYDDKTRVHLSALKIDKRAINFYQQLGFVPISGPGLKNHKIYMEASLGVICQNLEKLPD